MTFILCVVAVMASRQEPAPALRQEFDQLVQRSGLKELESVGDLIFSAEEKDFVLGAARLYEMRYNSNYRAPMRKAGWIAFRQARLQRWNRGYDAAETLLLAYAPREEERAPAFLQSVRELLKEDPDPKARKTLRLVSLLEGHEDPEFLADLAKDARIGHRSYALHQYSAPGGDPAFIAAFLKDPDPQIRRSAANRLIPPYRDAPEQAKAVAALLDDPQCQDAAIGAIGHGKLHEYARRLLPLLSDPKTRERTYRAMRNLDGSPILDDITRLLDHKDVKVRLCAVRLLGHWKVRARESVLALSLKDEDAEVREAAVEALVELPAEVSSESLAERLDDVVPAVRSRAAVALGRLNGARWADRIADMGKSGAILPGAAVEGLLRMTPPARPDAILDLLDALARKEPERTPSCEMELDRAACLEFRELAPLACERGLNDCMASLIERSSKYPPGRRSTLLQAVSWHGGFDLAKALDRRGLLSDKDSQQAGLHAMARDLKAREIPALMDLVRRLDPELKQRLSFAGGGPLPHLDEFAKFADDADPAVRRLVVRVLARDPKRGHIARLLKAAEDPDPGVRTELAQSSAYVASTEVHEVVGKLVKDADPSVAWSAMQAAGQIKLRGSPADVAALMKDEKRRVSAMFCLVRLGAKEHSAAIAPMLTDPESGPYAADLLAELGAPERVPDLLKAAEAGPAATRAKCIKAAAVLGGPIPNLGDLLQDKEEEIRAAAAFAFGTLGDRTRIATLAEMLKDPSYRVKAGALASLGALEARDHLPAILAFIEEQRLTGTSQDPEPPDETKAWAVQAAVDAVGRMGSPESAKVLARHLKRALTWGFPVSLPPAIIRLDPKPHMALILARADHTIFLELNRICAPKLCARLAAARPAEFWPLEYGTLDRLAARLTEAVGVKFKVDPSIPDDLRARKSLLHALTEDRPGRIQSYMHAWEGCTTVFDEERGEVRFVSVEEAKRYWLSWAN